MSKIKFPNTQGQPTDGTFKHEHNGRVWVWNGIVWKEPEDDTISYDESEQSLTYVNKLGKVKKINLNFTKASSLSVLADTLENLPDTSGSSNTDSSSNTDLSSISRISSVLTDKVNQINSRIDQIASSQNKLKNSLGGENYTPLYSDTNSLMGDFDKLREQINNLKQKESDIKSLVDSIKSSISSDPNFSSMDSAGNSVKETILNLSQRMEQIKSVVTSSGIGPDTDVASIITELYQTRAQLLANQSSALDTDALDQIPVIQEKIDKIQQSLGLDSAFEYNPQQATVSTVKGHIEDLYASKIESSEKSQPLGIASLNAQGKIEQEMDTFIEYDPVTNTLKYYGESSVSSNSGSQTLGLFDNHDSPVPSQEIELTDIPTKMTYNEFPLGDNPDVNVLRYYNEDANTPPNVINVKGAVTELKISDDKTKLLYTDENGGDPKEIPLANLATTLEYSSTTGNLVFNNGLLSKTVEMPKVEKITSMRFDETTDELVYLNEQGQEFRLKFPDTVTSFRIREEDGVLVYRDELGVDNEINIPEKVTELSKTDDGKLKYINEDLESDPEIIDISTNKVHIGQIEPSVKFKGLLWFQEILNQENQEFTLELKVWDGSGWKSATYDSVIANRIVSSDNTSSIHAEASTITISGNVEFNKDLDIYGKLNLNLPDNLNSIFSEVELGNAENLQLKIDYINLGNSTNQISLGVLDEGLTFDPPNIEKYTPKLTVNQNPVLTSSNREYIKETNVVRVLDRSVNYHFIKSGSKTILRDGRYIGHELTLVVNDTNGNLDPENCAKVYVQNATYTSTSDSVPNTHIGGMTPYSSNIDEVGRTIQGYFDKNNSVNILNQQEVTWCLYELRPIHRQQSQSDKLTWVYKNTSKTIYNCIWDGSSWLLNGGTVIPSDGVIVGLQPHIYEYWESVQGQ